MDVIRHFAKFNSQQRKIIPKIVRRGVEGRGVPRNFVGGRGGGGVFSTNSVEDRGRRGRGSGCGSPLVRGSGGSCNLIQEISFHTVKFINFWYFKTIYDDNQCICHC